MEFIVGMLAGGILMAITIAIRNARELKKDLQEEEYRQQRRKMYEEIEKNSNSEPYRFSVTKDEQGWRWEILVHYVSRGLMEDYIPIRHNRVFGYEKTQDDAIKVGKEKCKQMTQIKEWQKETKVYTLGSHNETT